MAEATYKIKISADTNKASQSFKQMQNSASQAAARITKAFNQIDTAVVKSAKSILKFGTSIYGKTLLAPLKILKTALLGAGAAFSVMAVKSMSAANDLTDAVGVTTAAFGENAKELHDWAKDQAIYYGLARTEAEKYFGTMGEFLKNAGVDSSSSALIAKNVAVRSAEVARSYGVSNNDAFNAISKAIEKGSDRALTKYGVALSESAYNAELLAEGINATYKELSEEEKLIVRYNTVMAQLGDLTGATADDFTTWEGAVAALANSAKDALASFGLILQHYLLPVIQVLTKVMQSVSASLSNLMSKLGIELPDSAPVEDYSDAIASLGENAKDAGKEAGKASGSLASFDKLNNISSGSGSGGGSAISAKNVKPVDKMGSAAKKNIKPISQLLDELMSSDWEKAGENVGDSINIVLGKLGELGEWLKTGDLGGKMGDFLNGLTNAGVWGNATKTLVTLLTGILTTIGEMFSVTNMMAIGKQLVDGLISGITENKAQIITELSNILDGISDFIIGFFDPSNMAELGTQLGDIVNGVAKSGSISKIAQALTTMLLGIMNFILNFVKTVNWLEIGSEILKGIGNAIMQNPDVVLQGLGIWLAWTGVKHLFTGLASIGQNIAGTIAGKISASTMSGGSMFLAVGAVIALIGTAISEWNKLEANTKKLKDSYSEFDKMKNEYEGQGTQLKVSNEEELNAEIAALEKEIEKMNSIKSEMDKLDQFDSDRATKLQEYGKQADIVVTHMQELGIATESVATQIDTLTNSNTSAFSAIFGSEADRRGYYAALGEVATTVQKGIADAHASAEVSREKFKEDSDATVATAQEVIEKEEELVTSTDTLVQSALGLVGVDLPTFEEDLLKIADAMEKVTENSKKLRDDEIKQLGTDVANIKEPLDVFLEQLNAITQIQWAGNVIDVDGLSTNLNTAVGYVQEAVKQIEVAISQASSLKNFETTLASNQTIKIDSSGKIGVNVDAKAHIDSSELQTWYTEYTSGQSYGRG